MNPITKLKYIKELSGYLKQDIKKLPIREKLATIKRMRELIQLLSGVGIKPQDQTVNQTQESTENADLEFIQKVISGEIEPSQETLQRMASIVQKYQDKKDMSDKVSQALNAWFEFLLAKADGLM
jgi:hypothetical protein